MKHLFFTASICIFSTGLSMGAPLDLATIQSTLRTRITTHGHTLQKELLDALAAQRKTADKHEHIELKQAQKILQEECDTDKHAKQAACSAQKKKLVERYKAEKKRRKEMHAQVSKSVSLAKREAVKPAKNLDLLLDQSIRYLEVLHTHAQTAQFSDLAHKAESEKKWFSSLQKQIDQSDLHRTTSRTN